MVDVFDGTTVTENKDLKYLLDEYDGPYKRAYTDITGLFDKSAYDNYGYYAYGSSDFPLPVMQGQDPYQFNGHFAQMRKKSDGLSPSNETPNANLRDSLCYSNSSISEVNISSNLLMNAPQI